MAKGIDDPSIDFGIQTFISGEVGEGLVVGVMGFYLLNVRSQVYYPGRIIKVGLGAGGGIKGVRPLPGRAGWEVDLLEPRCGATVRLPGGRDHRAALLPLLFA